MILAGGILFWGADEALAQSNSRSVCLKSSGSAAVTACKAALRAAPTDVKVARALARHYSTAKRFKEALEVLNAALARNPEHDGLLSDISIAKSNLAEQNWLKNRRVEEKEVKTGTGKSVVRLDGIRCRKLSNFAKALAACERALAAQPDDPDLRVARARHLETMCQTARAIADYRAAVASDPDNAEARTRLTALVSKPAASEPSKFPKQVAKQRNTLAAGNAQAPPLTTTSAKTDLTALFLEFAKLRSFHALVIGNNAYTSLPDLGTAIFDAQVVADVLKHKYGFKVTLLLDAARIDILKAMAKYRYSLTENDNLLIYYAGHGHLDRAAERGYWLPVDAAEASKANWVSTADITDMLKVSDAWHVLVVTNSCYSGTLVREAVSPVEGGGDHLASLRRLAEKKSRTVLTSGGLEPVTDGGGSGPSAFAKSFIDTLRRNNGVMDAESVFKMVREFVVVSSDQSLEYTNVHEAGHDGGDFVFIPRRFYSGGLDE